ncbi:MAG: hypothetical protein KGV56_03810, partial [Gammaproteobacteria bacterium]|nr:hypothetical protein [Gammaproteobacteria bacterium]
MNTNYKKQLAEKENRIYQQFAEFLPSDDSNSAIEVFSSSPLHFRQRAEFRLWHERDENGKNTGEVFYAMFETGKKASPETLQRTDSLPIASQRINELMPQL